MSNRKDMRVTVIGAGISGMSTAIALRRIGAVAQFSSPAGCRTRHHVLSAVFPAVVRRRQEKATAFQL